MAPLPANLLLGGDGLRLAVVGDGGKSDLIQLVAASVIVLTRGRLGLPGKNPAPVVPFLRGMLDDTASSFAA